MFHEIYFIYCIAACLEAYADSLDRYLCYVGCAFMAKQRSSDLLALFSISVHMKKGLESNILLVPDIPENDILTDPGLRKELLPGWWDTDGFKLPQTYIKTVPMDAGVSKAYSSNTLCWHYSAMAHAGDFCDLLHH